jgi:phage-related minor tail protein
MATKKIAGITIELDADTSKVVKGMDAVAKKVDAVGQSLQKVGTSLSKNLTAPIVAVGAASVKAFNEVDEGLDTITQKTGATGEEAEAMGEIMKNLATSIPTDFKTAGEAVGEVSTKFGVTGDKLESLSGQFVKFAQLNNTDVSNSIDSVQKACQLMDWAQKARKVFLTD